MYIYTGRPKSHLTVQKIENLSYGSCEKADFFYRVTEVCSIFISKELGACSHIDVRSIYKCAITVPPAEETIDNLTVGSLSDFSNLTKTKMFLKTCQRNTRVLINT